MKISAIICAYNEEETIKNVVTTVSDYFFDEVIVINDGSTDKTDEILRGLTDLHNLKYISLPENKGKGYAMATGVENSISEIITFIDADLSNLTEEHFSQLVTPVFNKEADMVLGQPSETVINYAVNPFKVLTGQRTVLKSDILPILEKIKSSRFGVETLINLYYKANGKKVKYISLNGLKHPTKFQKTSVTNATKEFVAEGHEIAITLFKNYDLVIHGIMNKLIKEQQKMKTKEIKKQVVADMNEAIKLDKDIEQSIAKAAQSATERAFAGKHYSSKKIKEVAHTMFSAAAEVAEKSGSYVKEVTHGAMKGVREGINTSTKKAKQTLKETETGVKDYSKTEIDKTKGESRDIEKILISTIRFAANKANKVVRESLNDLADKAHEAKSEFQIRIKNVPVSAKRKIQYTERDVRNLTGRTVEIGKSTLSGMQKGIKKGLEKELDKKQ